MQVLVSPFTCHSIALNLNVFLSGWNYKAADLMFDDNALQWANKLKYLGVTIVSGRSFSVFLDHTRKKYFASANGLNAHCKYV